MLSVLRNRDFALLWSAQLLSNLGGWLLVVAVPVYVYELTGSTVSTGMAFVAETLPGLVLGPLAGVYVDRWSRRTVMVVCDVARGLLVVFLVLVQDSSSLWLLYILIFAENSVTQLFQPATRALLPAVVGRGEDLASANSLYSLSSGIVRLAGAPVGGALYALAGFEVLVIVDAATYFVSAVMIGALRVRDVLAADEEETEGAPGGRFRRFGRDLSEGLVQLGRSPVLRGLLLVSGVYFFANGATTALLVPLVEQRLHGEATDLGLLLSALGAGFLISAPIARRLSAPHLFRWAMTGCLLGVGLCFLGVFNTTSLPVAVVLLGLAGIPGGAVLVVYQTQMQRATPDRVLGRVASSFMTAEMTATVVGAAGASVLAHVGGLLRTLDVIAALILVLGLAAPVLLRHPAGEPAAGTGDPTAERGTARDQEEAAAPDQP